MLKEKEKSLRRDRRSLLYIRALWKMALSSILISIEIVLLPLLWERGV